MNLIRRHGFHSGLRSHRHKDRRLDDTVRCVQPSSARPCCGVFIYQLKFHRLRAIALALRVSNQMTRRIPAVLDLSERWLICPATIDGDRTSGVESAAWGRVDRSRHVTVKDDAFLFCGWIRNRNGFQQCLGIGMLRLRANLPAGPDFN